MAWGPPSRTSGGVARASRCCWRAALRAARCRHRVAAIVTAVLGGRAWGRSEAVPPGRQSPRLSIYCLLEFASGAGAPRPRGPVRGGFTGGPRAARPRCRRKGPRRASGSPNGPKRPISNIFRKWSGVPRAQRAANCYAKLRRPLPPHDRRDLGMAKEKCLGWCRCCAPRAARRSRSSAWWRRKMVALRKPKRWSSAYF
jgi:hypothetical protein